MSTAQTTPEVSVARDPKVVRIPAAVVLHGVRYENYLRLRRDPSNDHLRMTYHDGTLELISPVFLHEKPSHRFAMLVGAVADQFELTYDGAGSTTIQRGEKRRKKGSGKEPDESFYFANTHRIVGNTSIDLEVDPPPDLWIEVDNRSSSRGRLPVYAALGIPEVWRYRARSRRLWFGRLIEGGTYEAIDRSVSLPMLTPALVLEGLSLGDGLAESVWIRRLRAWARETLILPGKEG